MAELYKSIEDLYVVEANRIIPGTGRAIAEWCNGVFVEEHDALQHSNIFEAVNVPTPNEIVRAQEGDWVTKLGVSFMVWSNEQFEKLFEAVE